MNSADAFHIGLLVLDIHIPASQSLKDKRKVLKSIKDRVKAKWNVSIAEVDLQDKWQRAGIAVCSVSCDSKKLESISSKLRCFVEDNYPISIIDWNFQYL